MSAAKRALNVQTPGAAPAAAPAQTNPPATDAPEAGAQATAPVEPPVAPVTTPDASTLTAKKPGKSTPTKAEYAAMSASQIDASTLTAPVLSRDGWVCPIPAVKG